MTKSYNLLLRTLKIECQDKSNSLHFYILSAEAFTQCLSVQNISCKLFGEICLVHLFGEMIARIAYFMIYYNKPCTSPHFFDIPPI